MTTVQALIELIGVLNSNHFAAAVLIALVAINSRKPPKA